jgi:hypothetical protein
MAKEELVYQLDDALDGGEIIPGFRLPLARIFPRDDETVAPDDTLQP